MRCVVLLGIQDTFNETYDCLVGVDRGAFYLAESGQKMDYAIGDFDSVSKDEFGLIQMYAKEIVQIPKAKDLTDSEFALAYLEEKGLTKIIIYGGLGRRFDHTLVNIKLLEKYPHTTLKDSNNKIFVVSDGTYRIEKECYKYLSFIPLSLGKISVSGVQYPLENRNISLEDTYLVSNEILNDVAEVIIEGKILVLLTND